MHPVAWEYRRCLHPLQCFPLRGTIAVRGVAKTFKMDEVPLGFHHIELNKTEWNVPIRYQDLSAIGGGAFGQVW